MKYYDIFQRAINVATVAHSKQTRKGKPEVPYIIHPLSVALILSRAGASDDVIIAGILHDTVEDSNGKVTFSDIEKKFGEKIVVLVEFVTGKDKTLSWEERKKKARARILEMPHDALLLKSADILHNLSDLLFDLEKYGEKVWERFNAPKEKQVEHHKLVVEKLEKVWPDNPLLGEIREKCDKLGYRNET